MKHLSFGNILLSAVVLFSNPLYAQIRNTKDLHPIIVYSSDGTLPVEASNFLLSNTTQSISKSIMTTLATASYGIDRDIFANAKPYRGQVDMIANLVRSINTGLQKRFGDMKASIPGKRTIRYQIFWTGSTIGSHSSVSSFAELLLSSAITRLVPLEGEEAELAQTGLKIGARALDTSYIKETTAILKQLQAESAVRFPDIQALGGTNLLWPLHIYVELAFDGSKGLDINLRFTLASDKLKQGKSDVGIALIDKLNYEPYKQGLGVVTLSFQNNYRFGTKTYLPPTAEIRFGRLDTTTMLPKSCAGDDCIKWIDALPTIYFQTNAKKASWWVRTQAWLASFDRFKMLVRSVKLNLSDFSLNANGSELLFHVDTYLGGTKIIDMHGAKASSWFEYFLQRPAAVKGNVLPAFDDFAKKSVNSIMEINLDTLIFKPNP